MTSKKKNVKLKKASMEMALNYQFEPVILRLKNKGFSKKEARTIFQDVKKFLWLCAANPGQCFVPPERIDAGWHSLIEFTETYQNFCQSALGRFVHHVPKEALPASFANDCRSCASCSSDRSISPPGEFSLAEQTIKAARAAFGKLSKNWNFSFDLKNLQSDS